MMVQDDGKSSPKLLAVLFIVEVVDQSYALNTRLNVSEDISKYKKCLTRVDTLGEQISPSVGSENVK
jgi:hypothetical protein